MILLLYKKQSCVSMIGASCYLYRRLGVISVGAFLHLWTNTLIFCRKLAGFVVLKNVAKFACIC